MLANVTLAVLAGGQGSRMGRPKGLLSVGGQPILGYLLDHLAWPGPTVLVTAPGRQHPPGWERFDSEAVDPVADEGPLRGLLTALQACATERLAVTTVDMPGLTRPQFEWLAGQLGQSLGVMCDRLDGSERQVEPFPLVLRQSAIETVERRLATRRRSVHGLADEPGIMVRLAPADWPRRVWVNLNTPSDLAAFSASPTDVSEG